MKKLILASLLFFASCGTDEITEVGNPTGTTPPKAATTSSGVVTAFNNGATQFFNSISSGTGSSQLQLIQSDQVEASGNFTCAYDSTTGRGTCLCPGGGSMTHVLTSTLATSSDSISIEQASSVIYEDCVLTTCNSDVTLTGETTGRIVGTVSRSGDTVQLDLMMSQSTAEDCNGLEVGETSIGYDMAITFDGQDRTFTGTICVNDTEYTFDTLDDLELLVDPDASCEEDFGPAIEVVSTGNE